MGGVRKRTRVKGLWVTVAQGAGKGGHYHARLRDKAQGGKPKWVPLGTDYEAAKKKLYEHRAGAPIPSRVTLAEAVTGWLAYLEQRRPNPNDQKLARVRTEQYLLKHFDPDLRLGALTKEHTLRYRAWLDKRTAKAWRSSSGSEKPEARKLSPLTVLHILSDFRALLKWSEITGRLDRSPFVSKLVMPHIAEKAPKGFSPAEVAALTSLPEPYGFVWRFLLDTGLRWGEAKRARADHVQDGMLLVEKAKGKRVRRVPVADESLLAEVRGRVGLLVPFVSSGSFARTCGKLARLTGVGVHKARHTYAMAWVAEGGSLAALQEVLGHKDLKTTMVYARVTDDLVKREAGRVYAQKNRVPGTTDAPEKERQKGA